MPWTTRNAAAQEAAGTEDASPNAGSETNVEMFELIGPVNVGGDYVGDINLRVAVDGSSRGEIDVRRLAQLLEPIVSLEIYEALLTASETSEFLSFAAASLGPLDVTYNANSLGIDVTIPGADRARGSVKLSGLEEPNPSDFAPPARFVAGLRLLGRKAFGYQGEPFDRNMSARAEGFVTLGGFEGYTLSTAIDYVAVPQRVYRLDGVTLTHDDFESALRFQAGKVFPQPVGLQNATELQGIGVSRRFQAIRPFQNIRPAGRQRVVLERPSTAEIYVNGVFVARLELAPGPYDLDDFPLVQGANGIEIIIRDSTGASQTIDRDVFYSPAILAPGLSDYGAWIGVPENTLISGGRPLVATGYYQRGVGTATMGANLQTSSRGMQLGGGLVYAFSKGFVSTDLAWGTDYHGVSGFALAADIQIDTSVFEENDFSLSARMVAHQRDFYSPILDSAINPVRLRGAANATFRITPGTSLNLGAAYTSTRSDPSRTTWSVAGGVLHNFGRLRGSATVQHERSNSGERGTSLRLGLSFPLGVNANITARYDSQSGRTEAEFSRFRRSQGPDWEARVTAGHRIGETDFGAQFQWYGQRAYAAVTHGSLFGSSEAETTRHRTTVDASTFVGFADGDLGWGREGSEGFSLVRVHSSLEGADARVEHYGQTVFRNDGLGPALLPLTRGYTPVEQEFFVENAPPSYSLRHTQQELFPGFKNGYRFTIGSDAYLSVRGILTRANGSPLILALGTLEPEREDLPVADFFTADDGSFFAQSLAEGMYAIVIDGQHVGRLEVAAGDDLMVDLGTINVDAE